MAKASYSTTIRHSGLNKVQQIKASSHWLMREKAAAKMAEWDAMYQRKMEREHRANERAQKKMEKEQAQADALSMSNQAQAALDDMESILSHTLGVDDAVQWSDLYDKKAFPQKEPKLKKAAREPLRTDKKYKVANPFLGKLLPFIGKKQQQEADEAFAADHLAWSDAELSKKESHKKALVEWHKAKTEYEAEQKENNDQVEQLETQYKAQNPEVITDYCDVVLESSQYPDSFPQTWNLDYNPDNNILIVDYALPSMDDIPTLQAVSYVATRKEFKEKHITAAAKNRMYDSIIYQITLRTIHELFEADVIEAIESIVFNGWVNAIDKSTGHMANACILSLQAGKQEFNSINLGAVEPKMCFKNLKGVGSSKLHGLTPIAPILQIDKEDARFVSAYEVVEGMAETDNLAAMDWQDFENLIREVFEKEFASGGGEVKITQASRDGGVDAVAFDPDPIRGGKIVIQAKRYTNTVGVGAVRDLYGTTVNEGATKGILVTTANFGPDAYEFAKGKPLTLLSGNNLLHLLAKHGHQCKIDLKEAKMILAEQAKNK